MDNNNSTDNVTVFWDKYKEELDRYNIPFEEVRDIFFKNFDKYPLKKCGVPGGLIMQPDNRNYNKELGAFDDYFFTTNYDSKHVHIKSVVMNDDLKEADCLELWNGFDCYKFGSDTDENVIYDRIIVDKYATNTFINDYQITKDALIIETYYNKEKTDKVYNLDIYSNYDIKYFQKNTSYRLYNKEADEFLDKLAALNIEPAVNLNIVKDNDTYKVNLVYNDPQICEALECSNEELNMEDTLPVDNVKNNYDQVTSISKLYYDKFIKPTISMVDGPKEFTL